MDNSGIKAQVGYLDRKIVELEGDLKGNDFSPAAKTDLSDALRDYRKARETYAGILDKRAARERMRLAEVTEREALAGG